MISVIRFLLLALPTLVLGLLFIGGIVVCAVAGMLIVRRVVPLHVLEAHHEVAGFIIAVMGVIYAVLLALVVIAVWEQFEDARGRVEREANELGDLYRDARAFPVPIQDRLLERIWAYTRVVVDEEWPAMARGMESRRARDALNELWQAYLEVQPRTIHERTFYSESVRHLNELTEARRLRLLASRDSLPLILWFMLAFGGITTVGFTYFFGLKNLRAQILMTAALAATIAFVLFVVLAMDYPFTGDVSVPPDALKLDLEMFESAAKR